MSPSPDTPSPDTPSPGEPSPPVVSAVRLSGARHRAALPLLVLGPSLGTSAATLWTECAAGLTDVFDVLAWDLPGHGHNRSVPDEPFTMAGLAAGVLRVVDDVLEQRGELGGTFAYAGNSVGGAVGLQLLLDVPQRVSSAVLVCTGATIGDPSIWTGRIDQVNVSGTPVLVPGSAERWFAPGFLERRPEVGSVLLQALSDTADAGYVGVCQALADFDVRDRLGEITAPVLAVSGAVDRVTPTAGLQLVVDRVRHGELVELEGVSHLAPAEAPEQVAGLIRRHMLPEPASRVDAGGPGDSATYAAGLVVRREVLGDAFVDAALAGTTDLTRDLEQLITQYAWGSIWTRPGLDRRSRSLIALTALVARGHHEELAVHVRAARTNGLSVQEISECLLQTAIYCGVPQATSAFRVAQRVLDEMADEDAAAAGPT